MNSISSSRATQTDAKIVKLQTTRRELDFYHDRKTLSSVLNSEIMIFLSKLARYCNFEQQVISLNLPKRRTISTCGKRTVVVYLICKIYNYISSRTIRFKRNVPKLYWTSLPRDQRNPEEGRFEIDNNNNNNNSLAFSI